MNVRKLSKDRYRRIRRIRKLMDFPAPLKVINGKIMIDARFLPPANGQDITIDWDHAGDKIFKL